MSAASATIRLDVTLQARSRLYAIGIAVAVMFGLFGRFVFDRDQAGDVLAVLYLMGIGGTTHLFGASLVLLEKSQGTLQALRVTPLTATAYMASKALTLTVFAAVESAVIYAVGFWGVPVSPAPLLAGIVCLGLFYTFVGLGQVAPHDSVFSFVIPGALVVVSILQWPFLYVLEIGPPVIWYLIPTQAPLLLMLGAFEPLEPWQWVYAISVSAASIILSAWWARRRFARFIGLKER